MAQYGFLFDSTRCTGCRTCTLACKDYKDLDQSHAFRKVYDFEGGSTTAAEDGSVTSDVFMYHVSAACNHCAEPACLAACPAGAIVKDEGNGLVYINQDACAGARACIEACPYGVPIFFEDVKKANKCDGCRDRVAAGLRPICVESCPLRALDFGEIEELRAAHPDAVDAIAPLPAGDATGPSLCIIAAETATADANGMVTNEKTLAGDEAWAS